MKVIFLLGTLTLMPLLTSQPASLEQEKRGSLSGTIIDADLQIIPGARVALLRRDADGKDSSRELTVYSDTKGAFNFGSLPIGKYDLQVIAPDIRLMRKLTTSIAVRDSENTTAEIRLQRIQQCDAKALGALSRGDEAEVIRLMLDEALIKKEIPSYGTLVVGNEALLSTKNIESHRVSNPPNLQLRLLSPSEIHTRARQQGGLMYLQFESFRVRGSCVAVQLWNLFADGTSTIETGPKAFGGEGCIYYVFYKQSGKWVGEYITGWIS